MNITLGKKTIDPGKKLQLLQSSYTADNSIALVLMDGDEQWGVASVCLPHQVPDGCVAIKDYSENEGIAETLTEAGVIGEVVKIVPQGFVEFKIYKFLGLK